MRSLTLAAPGPDAASDRGCVKHPARTRVVRSQSQRLFEVADRVLLPTDVHEGFTEVVVCVCEGRRDPQRRTVFLDGFVMLALFRKRDAEVVVSLRVPRLDSQRLTVFLCGILVPPLPHESDAQVQTRVRVPWLYCKGSSICLDRLIDLSLLKKRIAEV